jgi:hypothetical protein
VPTRPKTANGWVEILNKGMVVTLRGKRGWREVEMGRGSSDATCPVVALKVWLKLARIGHGPLFRRVTSNGKEVGPSASPTSMSPGSSSARRWPPGCAATSPRVNG